MSFRGASRQILCLSGRVGTAVSCLSQTIKLYIIFNKQILVWYQSSLLTLARKYIRAYFKMSNKKTRRVFKTRCEQNHLKAEHNPATNHEK